MRRKNSCILTAIPLLLCLGIWSGGCAKKAVSQAPMKLAKSEPPALAAPAPAAPTIKLSVYPNVLTKGQTTTLSWITSNATDVTLDNGIGSVANTGQRNVSPTSSTTYNAKASGPGGEAMASARVTVETPLVPPAKPSLSDSEFFQNRVEDVFFDFDKFDIRNDQKSASAEDAAALEERPNIKFEIEGHCDERGSEKYNLALGDRRANELKSYLVAHGVSASRIDTISYGKERPFDPGHNEDAWAKNRRDHFVLQ